MDLRARCEKIFGAARRWSAVDQTVTPANEAPFFTRFDPLRREPKLLIVYGVDDQGKLAKSFAPLIDGTLRGPDAWLSFMPRRC